MQKLSKSSVLDKEQETDSARQLARLQDATRYQHFTIGTRVICGNESFEVLDVAEGSLYLLDGHGNTRWVRPFAPVGR